MLLVGTDLAQAQQTIARKQLQFLPLEKVAGLEASQEVSKQDAVRLADSWIAALSLEDPKLAVGLVELLGSAPTEVVEEIFIRLSKDNALARVLDSSGNGAIKDRLRNSNVLNLRKIRDFVPLDFDKQLREAVESKSGSSEKVVALAAYSPGFRRLPRGVVTVAMGALDAGNLNEDARRELVDLLASHPQDLREVTGQLTAWRNSLATDELAVQRRNLALTVLLLLGEGVTEVVIRQAFASKDVAATRAALAALEQDSAPWSKGLSELGLDQLKGADHLDDWNSAYRILARRSPGVLENQYELIGASEVAQTWSPEMAAEWVSRAPQSASKYVANFPLDLYASLKSDTEACGKLKFELAVLGAQASIGTSTLAKFWQRTVKMPHGCSGDIGESIDAYLGKAGKVENTTTVLGGMANEGLGNLVGWNHGSNSLSSALGPSAATRVTTKDAASAKEFILAQIPPQPGALSQLKYWEKPAPRDPSQLGWHLRILQADRSAPEAAFVTAASIANSQQTPPVPRAQALLAIAAGGRLAQYQNAFSDALMSDDKTVSETAAKLWSHEILRGTLNASALKEPSDKALTTFIERTDISPNTGLLFLSSLVKANPKHASLYAGLVNWTETPSTGCFALATVKGPPLSVAENIFGAAASRPDSSDELRACVAVLFDPGTPAAFLARNWAGLRPSESANALPALKKLWEAPEFSSASSTTKNQIATLVSSAAAAEPYTPAGQAMLDWWSEELKKAGVSQAGQVQTEYQKRKFALVLLAIPGAIMLHFAVWGVLLFLYPRSKRLQAIVFWNPLVRKVLGLGYMDLVLLYVPFARKRLFSPFKALFLKGLVSDGAEALDTKAYFAESLVRHKAAGVGIAVGVDADAIPIVNALKTHNGRVLLQGKSGLGKSSFLRNWLSRRADDGEGTIVYLRADECKKGVEAEIQSRMSDLGSDQKLLRSVIYSGRMSVYIDGYNEVDLATQEAITSFLASYPDANILVTSQIPLRGLSSIETYELLPLDRGQITQFLLSRNDVLSFDAPVRGEKFHSVALAFLEDTWAKPSSEDETKALAEILANPMDLTSVALLLSGGGVPELFSLEQQQFNAVRQRMATQSVFRTTGFSKALLEQRLKDQEDLSLLPFKPEVAGLIYAKLANVRTFTDPSGKVSAQEVRFRHDRIRDFFTHFALLELSPAEQATYATDTRLAGVFPYLARSMPKQAAEDLRERLLSVAADIEDHRVSDSFVREYSWRQRLSAADPTWMLSFDLMAAKDADSKLNELQSRRAQLASSAVLLQQNIARSRHFTRLLTESDHTALVRLAAETLVALGASDSLRPMELGPILSSPHTSEFVVVALVQAEAVCNFHIDLLLARLDGVQCNVLVVANWEVKQPPDSRPPSDLQVRLHAYSSRIAVVTSCFLYEEYRRHVDEHLDVQLWHTLATRWGMVQEHETDAAEKAS
ncbi:hypothetical protein NWF24_20110 [Variovorax paradoxus]|uniref:NACHT domain-containing protein n=1 Tax=Variovorax paradoxus TaxID=34073 RepID=UPI0021ABBA59|nr:hypothetical protein [Variovorax paradoxus]UVH55136.1 hypothetical protein NWF24_20110 [Variovorax paradoxus]